MQPQGPWGTPRQDVYEYGPETGRIETNKPLIGVGQAFLLSEFLGQTGAKTLGFGSHCHGPGLGHQQIVASSACSSSPPQPVPPWFCEVGKEEARRPVGLEDKATPSCGRAHQHCRGHRHSRCAPAQPRPCWLCPRPTSKGLWPHPAPSSTCWLSAMPDDAAGQPPPGLKSPTPAG